MGDLDHLSFHLSDEFVHEYEHKEVNWGFDAGGGNSLGELTWLTKYSRVKEDGTKETWHEGCRRVIEGMFSILKDHCVANRTPWNHPKAARAAEDAYDRLFHFKWTPPGRGLWMMGTPFVWEEGSAGLQNCAFLSTEHLGIRNPTQPFTRLMEMSMLGIGVGFDTLGAGKLTINGSNGDVEKFVIPDSREGWVESVDKMLRSFFTKSQPKIEFDYDKIRPAGLPLRRFGGTSAGPEPLRRLHEQIRDVFGGRDGEVVNSTDITDIMNLIGKCLPGDAWVLTVEGPRQVKDLVGVNIPLVIDGEVYEMESDGFFQTGAKQVYRLETQEGWSVRLTADHQVKMADGSWREAGTLLPGDEVQLHEHGDFSWEGKGTEGEGYVLGHLVGDGSFRRVDWGGGSQAQLYTWDQDKGVDGVRKEILSIVGAMPHRSDWQGWRYNGGEGRQQMQSQAVTRLAAEYGIEVGNKTVTDEVEQSSSEFSIGFLRGLFDTDGSAHPETRSISLSQSDLGMLQRVQRMLGRLGILSTCYETGRGSEARLYIGGQDAQRFMDRIGFLNSNKTDRYYQKPWVRGPYNRDPSVVVSAVISDGEEPVYDVTVAGVHAFDANGFYVHNCVVAGSVRRSAELALGLPDDEAFLDLKNPEVNPKRMGADGWGFLSNNSVLASVGGEYGHLVDRIAVNGEPGLVYIDLMRDYGRLVDPPNGRDYRVAGVNPCAEQSLENHECCTLVETYPVLHEDLDDWIKTLKWAYLYGKAVTLLPTHWAESNEVMQRNRRIGTSVSGQAQFAEKYGWAELRRWLDTGYKAVGERDVQYSEWLGVRESIKTTTVKPSGTVSLLSGVTPGVHWPEHTVYTRRMRFRWDDPIIKVFKKAGYKVEKDVMDPTNTSVVEFPTRGPEVRSNTDVSVWEKVSLAALHQRFWSDNAVSATFTFRDDEKDQIGPILRSYDGQLKTMSFLPMLEGGAYAQMPYEAITVEEWQTATKGVKKMDLTPIYQNGSDPEGERFCTTDICEI